MKVLTPLFLVYYIYQLFSQHKMLRSFNKRYEGEKWIELTEKAKADVSIVWDMLKLIGLSFIHILIIFPVEFIYICNSFTVNKTVALAYLVLWLVILFKGIIKFKLNKNKKKDYVLPSNWKLSTFIINVIDVLFFGYMFYMLMIK